MESLFTAAVSVMRERERQTDRHTHTDTHARRHTDGHLYLVCT